MKIKHIIREFSLRLIDKTNSWVIPHSIWVMIDDEKFDDAKKKLDKIEKIYPNDPEITRARSLITFIEG